MTLSLQEILNQKHASNSFRKLKTVAGQIDFTSNDYLGLANSKELFATIQKEMETISPPFNGGTGSRLLSGNTEAAENLETKLAAIFKSQKTLLFNSGYNANLAVMASLPQRGDTIIYDELTHASIRDGAKLSVASHFSFKHNDLADLEEKIKRASGNVFVVVESIYSMDGDECPLEDLVSLNEKYNTTLVLDEAHSTGSYGAGGGGLAMEKKIENNIAVRLYTFGKAMGVHGACIAGNEPLIDYLINFARPLIFTTAMPPHSLVSIRCAFDFLKQQIHRQQILQSKIILFLEGFEQRHVRRTASRSAIQNIIVPGNSAVKKLAHYLQEKNFDCRPILSPSVREGSERIRICLHSFNTDEEIVSLNQALNHFRE